MSDYKKYRGKCKEMSEALIAQNPELALVRGHYHCPIDGPQQHWWCKDKDGKVIDPTVKQFKVGFGEYVEFDGRCQCDNCGKEFIEGADGSRHEGRYSFCSYKCNGQFVGVF